MGRELEHSNYSLHKTTDELEYHKSVADRGEIRFFFTLRRAQGQWRHLHVSMRAYTAHVSSAPLPTALAKPLPTASTPIPAGKQLEDEQHLSAVEELQYENRVLQLELKGVYEASQMYDYEACTPHHALQCPYPLPPTPRAPNLGGALLQNIHCAEQFWRCMLWGHASAIADMYAVHGVGSGRAEPGAAWCSRLLA